MQHKFLALPPNLLKKRLCIAHLSIFLNSMVQLELQYIAYELEKQPKINKIASE